jgi:acetoin utilization deacetylase AcuC-like enzyme
MMTEAAIDVFWDERVLEHDTGSGLFDTEERTLLAVPELHPENVERVLNMKSVLELGPIASLVRWHPGRLAELDELAVVHDRAYLSSIEDACRRGGGRFTKTTHVVAGSWDALLAAAGTCLEAADAVLDGRARIAYALVRPPGHHAQPAQADGFCFLAHETLVAERARARGIERVAVVDWDVHHGNGTQECFYRRADVLTISLHMAHGSWGPSHPQIGSAEEVGEGEGEGFNVNVELGIGAGDATYADAISEIVAPIVRQFRPGLIVGACGQDASAFDPNGRQNVTMAGFRRIGRLVAELAEELCDGRLVLVQEGGYGRTYSGYCLHATLEGVLGLPEPLLPDLLAYVPDDARRGREGIEATRARLSRYWRLGA